VPPPTQKKNAGYINCPRTRAAQLESRHWWLVSKLQESFGDQLRSTQLESFLCQPETVPALIAFAGANPPPGHRCLFVSRQRAADGAFRFVADFASPAELFSKVSYFVRRDAGESGGNIAGSEACPEDTGDRGSGGAAGGAEADQAFQNTILWGEVNPDLLSDMKGSLRDLCTPLLQTNTDWGKCSRATIQQLFTTIDKFVASLPSDADALKSILHIPEEAT